MKNLKRIEHPIALAIVIIATLIVYTIIFAFIASIIDNASLSVRDYGNADVSRKQESLKYVSRKTGIDVSDGDLYFGFDDHGGFHGDGITYLEIKMPASIDTVIAENGDWHPFPVPDTIDLNVCQLRIDKHRSDYEQLLPEIENGWYYFNDRSPEPYCFYHYIIAVYDSDTKVFYFCKHDS